MNPFSFRETCVRAVEVAEIKIYLTLNTLLQIRHNFVLGEFHWNEGVIGVAAKLLDLSQ